MKNSLYLLLVVFKMIEANAQCLNGVIYPGLSIKLSADSVWHLDDAWTGEYSNIQVVAGDSYVFSSSVHSDMITISNAKGDTVLKNGNGSVSYTPGFTGVVRFYRHLNAQCGVSDVDRRINVVQVLNEHISDLKFYFGGASGYESEGLQAGKTAKVPVRIIGFQNISSFQFTIRLSPCSHMKSGRPDIIDVKNVHPNLNDIQFSIDPQGNYVTLTWNSETSLSFKNSVKLFDIVISGPGTGPPEHCCETLLFSHNPNEMKAYRNDGLELNIVSEDTHGICEAQLRICGCISREDGASVPNVKVKLLTNNLEIDEVLTDVSGCYEFRNLISGNNYTVVPSKIQDAKKGIDQNDASLVARYAKGQVSLDSPYKIIAADVKADPHGRIRLSHAQLISKVAATGYSDGFGGQPVWKFVDAGYEFPDVSAPDGYRDWPDSKVILHLDGEYCSVDFVGIKMGDINMSTQLQQAAIQNIPGDGTPDFLQGNDQIAMEGATFALQIKAGVFQGVKDFQLGFSWNMDQIEFVSFLSNRSGSHRSALQGLYLGSDSIPKVDGRVYLGWYDPDFDPAGVSLLSEDIIVEMIFRLKDPGIDVIHFEQDTSIRAFYTNAQNRPVPVGINFRRIPLTVMSGREEQFVEKNYRIFPTISSEMIQVQTSQTGNYLVEIYDFNGRQMFREICNGDAQISTMALISGQYMVRLVDTKRGEVGSYRFFKR